MKQLRVVKPLGVTPAMLVSTDVPEAEYPEWASGTTYAKGARVILAAQHKIYQSAADSNTGNNPATLVPEPKWLEVGPTNRWKVFDSSNSTQTVQANKITYRIKPGVAVPAVGVLNIRAGVEIKVTVFDAAGVQVTQRTMRLSRYPVAPSWWVWNFGEKRAPTQALFTNLPSYSTGEIQIEITGTADLAVGVILLGSVRTFALGVKAGARVGIQDYSRKERTEFGDTVLVERAFAKRASLQLLLSASEVDALNEFMAEVRAKACLWIGSDRYESTVVYGFFKNFEIAITYYDYSDCELELEGLT
ncbi:carbohydrate-binding protein [Delftia tsuruhatensis]|uniref:carbohydrate-binding protein n=1 Tax=Delftia tsuruhatensis TaxID=180282 RepID=UPI003A876A91